MPQIIPLTNDPDRKLTIELGDNLLNLRTYYNPTVPGWYMDIEGHALGLALVPYINVLQQSPELTRTLGQFRLFVDGGADVIVDSVPFSGAEGLDVLGQSAQLWWFAPGEWVLDDEPPTLDPVISNVRVGSVGYDRPMLVCNETNILI